MERAAGWAKLRKAGFTVHRVIEINGRRRAILQSRYSDDFPGITHLDDLTPEQRQTVVEDFLDHWDN